MSEITETLPAPDTATDDVLDWRELCLLQMGVAPEHAHALALLDTTHLDLHRFADLRQHGCPPELAERILL